MRTIGTAKVWLGMLCAAAMLCVATPAQAEFSDPLFFYVPVPPKVLLPGEKPVPPPTGYFNGPCGVAVDSAANFYVSDYYHHGVDVFAPLTSYSNPSTSATGFITQLANEDPLDGPCQTGLDAANNLYVNNYHRNVVRFAASPTFGTGTVISGAPLDSTNPTGLAVDPSTADVYVNDRTYVAAYDSSGAAVMDGGEALKIGLGSLTDGYGLALSRFPGTLGRIYVPDAATNTVKVYDPALDKIDPVATIAGPGAGFTSLRDASVAVDNLTGEIYVTDNTQPLHTEKPQAIVDVFSPAGTYKGHLKYKVVDALPVGLAVDNSAHIDPNTGRPTQGRVYVTSGNTNEAGLYAYPPGAATMASPLAPLKPQVPGGAAATAGSGQAQTPAARGLAADDGEAKASEIVQEGALRLNVNGRLAPQALPRTGDAPIAVSVDWSIATTDGSAVPTLKKLRIEINRNGRFDNTGLPTCPLARIQPASSSRALANCRAALVGQGTFSANVALREQEPYATKGRLLVFNGLSHGKPVLLGQIYSPHPFPTSFVIPFRVQALGKGTYGTALDATLPKSLVAWGNLTGIEMKLSRHYGFEGERHSYISAGCPAPKGFSKAAFPLARASFGFEGGTKISSVFSSTCRAKG